MSDNGALNLQWSQRLVAAFTGAGVTHAVISPGSRSTPLALALLRHPGLACEIIVDERSAAFFALGIAKASQRPVLVLATSGSAPANWLPAVIEADRAGVPLILVSADRPAELHDCGANQTTDQGSMLVPYARAVHRLESPAPGIAADWLVRLAARAVEQAQWPLAGPVHINLPFREPLLPTVESSPPAPALPVPRVVPPATTLPHPVAADLAARLAGGRGVIVCGEGNYPPGFAAAVARLAERLDCPLLAEPLSGLRHGPHDRSRLCTRYEGWLRNEAFLADHQPAWLLRFGAFPVTRSLQGFVSRARQTLAWVDPQPHWHDPSGQVTDVLRADPLAVCTALLAEDLRPAAAGWAAAFAAADTAAARAAGALPASSEGRVIPALLAALPDGCPVFVGNSLLIRDVDAFGGSGERMLTLHGNRGTSGIDGNVSTAAGIAAAAGRVVALLGDLTCQHDLGGFATARGRQAIFVVFNNGGGSIFEHLPQASLPEFETGWLTPQGIDFAAAAATFGLAYALTGEATEVVAAVSAALSRNGPTLIEIRLDRQASVAARQAWWQAVAQARWASSAGGTRAGRSTRAGHSRRCVPPRNGG